MYAIVNIAGQQFKVEKGKKVFVNRLSGNVGDELNLGNVMLISNEDKVSIGEPYLAEALVFAKINAHIRGDKVQVFKKKRRKGYQVLNGHRQNYTELLIEDIAEDGKVSRPAEKPVRKTAKKPADEAQIADAGHEPAVEAAVTAKKASKSASAKTTSTKVSGRAKAEKTKSKPAARKSAAKKNDSEK